MTARRMLKGFLSGASKEIILTGILLLCSIVLLEYSNIDIWVQDAFYNFELRQWILDRDEKITRFIFYDGIKKIFILVMSLVLIGLLFFRKIKLIQVYQEGLLILCLSVILIPSVVGILKATTNVPCPRDITRYNGRYPYVTVLTPYPENFQQTEKIRCFPAGHASGGFALLSLFFLFKKRKNRFIALFSATIIGWALGGYKMLIGDHFLSHTVVTMILAWLIILIIAKNVQPQSKKNRSELILLRQ